MKLVMVIVGAAFLAVGATPSSAQSLQKVTYAIATADLNVGYPFATLAKQLGYFKEEGLDVDIIMGQSSNGTMQLLLNGGAHVGILQPNPVIVERTNANVPLLSFYPVSRRGSNVVLVPLNSPIREIKDLKGKKAGVPTLGSGVVSYLQARLGEEGMTMNDVQLVAIGNGTPAFEAFKNGGVDVAVVFRAYGERMRAAGYDFRTLPQPEAEKNLYTYNLFATVDYIAANPNVIRGIGRATAKAGIFIKHNPEAVVRAFWAYSPAHAPKTPNDSAEVMKQDLAIITATAIDMAVDEMPNSFAWGSQDAAVYANMQKFLLAIGQLKEAKDPSIFFTNAFAADYIKFDAEAIAAQAKAAN